MEKLAMLAKVVRQQNEEDKKRRARETNRRIKDAKVMSRDENYEQTRTKIRNKNVYEKDASCEERPGLSGIDQRFEDLNKDKTQIDKNETHRRFHLKIPNDLRRRKSREEIVKVQEEYHNEEKNKEEIKSLVYERKNSGRVYELNNKDEIGQNNGTARTNGIPYDRTEITEDKNLDKDWEIAEMPNGRYFLDFKSPYFTMNERIKIIEAALEDIRERYYDAKDEYNQFNRKCSKMKRKRRATGLK